MFDMSPLESVVIILGLLAILVIWLIWRGAHPDKRDTWPTTQGTIQSVNRVVVHAGRSSYSVDVGDFSYIVNDEYYSGRLAIAPNGECSPRGLVNQKIEVRYNPDKPETSLVPQMQVGGFQLGPYSEPNGEDVDPIDLNIDKI